MTFHHHHRNKRLFSAKVSKVFLVGQTTFGLFQLWQWCHYTNVPMVFLSIIHVDVDYMILLNTYLAIFTLFSCSYCNNYSNTICLLQRYDKNSKKNRPETLFHNIVIYCYDHEKTYGSNTYTLQDMFKLAKTHHKGASEMNITIYELNINSIWNTS